MPRDVICQRPDGRIHGLEYRVCIGLKLLLRETSFWGNGLLCRLRMYHYGWLCEELTLISEMYSDAMDENHCNSAKKILVPKFCFFDFVGDSVHRGP